MKYIIIALFFSLGTGVGLFIGERRQAQATGTAEYAAYVEQYMKDLHDSVRLYESVGLLSYRREYDGKN